GPRPVGAVRQRQRAARRRLGVPQVVHGIRAGDGVLARHRRPADPGLADRSARLPQVRREVPRHRHVREERGQRREGATGARHLQRDLAGDGPGAAGGAAGQGRAQTGARPGRAAGRPDPLAGVVRSRAARAENLAGWLFVLPAAALIGLFGIVPIGWSLLLSFQHNDLLAAPEWIGLDNYRQLADDPVFRDSIRRTLVYTALFVPLSVFGALGIALLLDAKIRFIRFYRPAVFVPVATLTVATGTIFNWLLDPTYGIANFLLGKVGLGPYGFFQDPDQALYAIVAMTVWGWLGFDVIIYLAALQGIPQDLLEAAELDNAGRWGTFRHVILPLLSPATLFLIVWSTINALQVFDEIYVTTRGGPLHATTVLVYYLYNQAFELFHAGYAAAVAEVLFAITLVFSIAQLWIGNRRVHYTS